MVEAVIYSLSLVVVSGLVISYGIAFNLKPSQHIGALFLFILSVWVSCLVISIKLWLTNFGLDSHIDGVSFRSLLILVASANLMRTTWKKDIK